MRDGFLLGLDWGGSGARALLLDVSTGAVAVARRPAASAAPAADPLGAGPLDLEAGLRALGDAARAALGAAGAAPARVLGVAVASVRFGHVALGPGGAVLDAWGNRDARAALEALRLAPELGPTLARVAGHWPQPILAAARLLRLGAEEPRLADPASRLLAVGDWIGFRLTGEVATERSHASHSGLFDLAEDAFSAALAERLGLPATLFPRVGRAGERLGGLTEEGAARLGLRVGTPVALGGSDSACALLGAAAAADGVRLVLAGTTLPVLGVTARPACDARLWTECHVLPARWMVDSNAGPAGEALEWLAAWLEPGPGGGVARLLARAAQAPPGANGMASSFGAQVFDARSLRLPAGALFGAPLFLPPGEATRAAAARAALEGVAFAVRANLAQLDAALGPARDVLLAGGLSRGTRFGQLLADVLGRPVEASATPEASALGAALCAAAAAGLFSDPAAAARALVRPSRRFEPEPAAAAAYAELAPEAEALRAAQDPAAAAVGRRALAALARGAARTPPVEVQAREPRLLSGACVTPPRPRILATADLDAEGLAALGALGPVEHASFRERGRLLTGPALVEALAGFEVFVTEVDLVDASALAALPALRVVASCRGDAVNVDLGAATAHGVPVLHAPGRNAEAVADLTLAFLLALARRLAPASAFLRRPDVAAGDLGRMGQAFTAFRGRELGRCTVGLVGLGAVGRAVARRLRGFGTRVLACDPFVDADAIALAGAEPASLEALLAESDFVSLHAPVSEATEGLLGARELARMRPGACLVNTARAALVDEEALLAALREGRLGGAALDVFAEEPPGADHPLLALENVIATPHVGGNTRDVAAHQGRIVADDLARLLRGERPHHVLNPEALEGFAWSQPRRAPDAETLARLAARPGPAVSDLQRDRRRAPARARAAAAPAVPAAPREEQPAAAASSAPQLAAATRARFEALVADFAARAAASEALRSAARGRDVTLHFRVPDAGLELHLRLADDAVAAARGAPPVPADVELRLAADVLDGMFTGRVQPMQAALDGRLSFTGDTGKAMTLQHLQGELARLWRAARAAVGDPGDLAAAEAPAGAAHAGVAADDPRVALVQVVEELYAQQLITATGGNVSVRIPGRDEVWITPSQLFKGDLRPEVLVRIDLAGRPLDPGARAPSSERMIHCAVYAARPEAGAVIHAHAPHATTLANADLPFVPISTEAAFFGEIPRVPFLMPGTPELAHAVGEGMKDCWAVLMKNHGLVVAGRSLRRAADMVEIVERSSQLILGCHAVGREPPRLPDEALQTLRRIGDLVA